jgi:hypothetical protein
MRFPAERVPAVAEEIRTTLKRLGAKVLVCSAACGADLLALEAAGQLGIRRRIVLPFDRDQFRQTSVVDRPGHWGELYDRILDDVQSKGDLVVLGFQRGDKQAYRATNQRLLAEAEALADDDNASVRALIVWEGKSRGPDDVTAQFFELAHVAGVITTEILTMP